MLCKNTANANRFDEALTIVARAIWAALQRSGSLVGLAWRFNAVLVTALLVGLHVVARLNAVLVTLLLYSHDGQWWILT